MTAQIDIFDSDAVIAALDGERPYVCRHCPARFISSARIGGHVHAAHPEVKRSIPKFLRQPRKTASRPSLKRDTDTWPGKP